MKTVGVDWAGKGWLAATLADDGWAFERHPSMLHLWREHRDADRILVDVPIGLPERERRDCDEAARERLGSARSSVFWTPCRAAVATADYEAATAKNEERTGHGVSTQAWAIVPRVREVDAFLLETPAARGRVRESHPEVCFRAFGDAHGSPDVGSKQDEDGLAQRRDLLGTVDDDAPDAYREAVERLVEDPPRYAPILGSGAEDDLLDAMVLALTGREDLAVLGGDVDAAGLPMEIVYPDLDGG